tara:strand:+ start:69 stop:1034 length:966 start_codon:yes stop_codon:yes gene_type:complete
LNRNKFTILVTGASGFIGRPLITQFLKEGHRVIGVVRKRSNYFNSNLYEDFVIKDICEDFRNLKFDKIDIIVHLAAITHSKYKNYNKYKNTNVNGIKNVINLGIKVNVKKIIMISSIKVNGEGFANNSLKYSENSPLKPKDEYGLSKLESENILIKQCINNNISYIILRPSLVYGSGVKGNLLSLMKYIDRGIPLPLLSSNNKRSILSLNNLINAIILSLYDKRADNNVFLISDDLSIKPGDLYIAIAEKLNKNLYTIKINKILLKFLLWPLGKIKLLEKISNSLIIDNTKIKEKLGWKSIITFDDEIKNMVNKYKQGDES